MQRVDEQPAPRRAESILEVLPDLVLQLDARGLVLHAHVPDPEELPEDADDLVGSTLEEAFPDAVAGKLMSGLGEALASGVLQVVDYRLTTRRGGEERFSARLVPSGSDEAVATIRTVTGERRSADEQRRLTEELRRANAFLDAIVENIPDMIFVKEAEQLRFVRFNRAGEELLGMPREEMLGKNDHDFFPKSEADFFTSKDRAVLSRGEPEEIPEEPIHTRSLGLRTLHTKKVPIQDPETGEALYLLGISADITERKRRERELKKLVQAATLPVGDAFFPELTRHLAEAVGTRWAFLGEVVDSSAERVEMCALWGRDGHVDPFEYATRGTPCYEALTSGTRACYPSGVQAAFPDDAWLNEQQVESYLAVVLRGTGGEILGHLGLMHDEPLQRIEETEALLQIFAARAAAELERSRVEEERKQDELARALLREIHHRIKNNLEVVQSLLQLQARRIDDPRLSSVLQESSARIRAMSLIHEQLYRTRDVAGLDFANYLEELIPGLARSYGMGEGVRVELEASPVTLSLDASIPCGLIVHELVANALQHAFPDGRPGRVVVGLSRSGDEVRLEVSDDGVGLAEASPGGEGTTLGLELVEGLSRQIDGALERSSEDGTRFVLRFVDQEVGT